MIIHILHIQINKVEFDTNMYKRECVINPIFIPHHHFRFDLRLSAPYLQSNFSDHFAHLWILERLQLVN